MRSTALARFWAGFVVLAASLPAFAQSWRPDEVVIRLSPGATIQNGSIVTPDGAAAPESLQVAALDIRPAFDPAPTHDRLAKRFGLDRYYIVRVPDGAATPEFVASISGGVIESAELCWIGSAHDQSAGPGGGGGTNEAELPNDPFFPDQFALYQDPSGGASQSAAGDADINALGAWNITTGSTANIIAILDAGVSHSHPDIASRLLLLPGGNFAGGLDPDLTDDDSFSHGTFCAGIIAAGSDNGVGITGLDWTSKILPVRIAGITGNSSPDWVANGVVYSADNLAQIINISYGFTSGSSMLEAAVQYAHARGCVIVASAGNVAGTCVAGGEHAIRYPAAYPEVIAVGATDDTDTRACWSAYGPELSVVAPGVGVISTFDTWFNPDTYTMDQGTSFAAPHVAGLASLVLAAAPWLSPDEVRVIIEQSAQDLGDPGYDELYGWGRIDAWAAVRAAGDLATPCFADTTTQGAAPGEPGFGVPDGEISAADLNLFINWWIAQDLNADLTTIGSSAGEPGYARPDGIVTNIDLSYYVTLWATGCD